jgi:TetR/AcrR family transcriptional regulator, transcriptional repressor for nem operon
MSTARASGFRSSLTRPSIRWCAYESTGRDFTRGCLIGGFGVEVADHSDAIREAVHRSLESWEQALAAPIAQAQESGQVAAVTDARTFARFILSAWEGTLIFDIVFGTLLA